MSLFKWIPAFLIAFSMTLPAQFAQAKNSGKTGKKAAAEYMKASKSRKKTVSVTKKTKSKKQAVVQKKSNKKLAAQQVKQKRNVASVQSKSKMKSNSYRIVSRLRHFLLLPGCFKRPEYFSPEQFAVPNPFESLGVQKS